MTLALRSYQQEDLGFFIKTPKSLILYEPRVGKTVEAMGIICHADSNCHNILIIAPYNAFLVWEDHIKDWFPVLARPGTTWAFTTVMGDTIDRGLLWKFPKRAFYNIFICTQGAFLRDAARGDIKPGDFDTIFVDEYHKWLLSRNKTFQQVRPFVLAANRFHVLSGTPIDRGPH